MKLVRGETSYIEYILHFSLRENSYNHGFIAELTFLLNILVPVADRLEKFKWVSLLEVNLKYCLIKLEEVARIK